MDFLAARPSARWSSTAPWAAAHRRAASARASARVWNVTNPDVVAGIHRAYFDAGADIVDTNTFGGSRREAVGLPRRERTQEFNEAAARLAVAVRDEVAPGRWSPATSARRQAAQADGRHRPPRAARRLRRAGRGAGSRRGRPGGDDDHVRPRGGAPAVKAAREVSRLPVSVSMTFNRRPRAIAR